MTVAVAIARQAALAEIRLALEAHPDGWGLYQSMIRSAQKNWGTEPGREYSLGRLNEEGDHVTVIHWKITKHGFVDGMRLAYLDTPLCP